MKPLVILIPGSKVKASQHLSFFVNIFCNYFGVEPNGDHLLSSFKAYLEADKRIDVLSFSWSGGISETLGVKPAARKLAEIIKKNKYRPEIVLFGKSLGGVVAEKAIQFADFQRNVSRIIYVATPHRSSHIDIPNSVKIVNIYSDDDNYVPFGNFVLYQHFHGNELKNAENIMLPHLRHSAFNHNQLVEFKKDKIYLFDLYLELLLAR